MESIGIDELKRGTNEAVCYADDCLFVSESLQCLCTSEPVRLDFSLMVFCMEGCVEWEQNGSFCALHEHDFVITLPGTLLTNLVVSDDCRMKVVCVSDRFLRRMLRASTNVWHVIRFVKSNPLKHLSDSDFEYLLRYVDLISIELKNGASIYREEIVQHLFAVLIFGMLSDINRCMASENETDRDKTTTPVYMFRRFMEEVSADNGCHRSVTYYAGRLCCLPSYLSRIVKKVSGRRALAIIDEHVIDRIAFELKYSDKSVKEIAMEFDFPNISFFSKYVRKHLKVSPTAFRNMALTDEK